MLSMHRLTAGAGYRYLKNTASGDCDRTGTTPLTAYHTETGNPPGRWLGAGLAGLAGGSGIESGSVITEQSMANLFRAGKDPITAVPLGRAYPALTRCAARSRALELAHHMSRP